jgi:Fe-S-cluster containining protein
MSNRRLETISMIKNDFSSGLLYTHTRINDNTRKILESTSFLYGLIELLSDKGVITIEELDDRKKQVAERLVRKFSESGLGLMYQDPEYDKYSFEHGAGVDCESRIATCRAACCRIPFALSRQDVEEGIIRWEFGRPYLIAHDGEGYCVHLDRETYRCNAYGRRPIPCRGFNCSNGDKWKVWLDYEQQVIDPEFEERIVECNGSLYRCREG